MPFTIVRNDITRMETDAIVNAANSWLKPGGGVCGAIFAAAGFDEMARACEAIGGCAIGSAVITKGFALPAKYVIHAVGPIYTGGGQNEPALLQSCYRSALQLAAEYRLKSIAFPLISSGIYGYPKAEALRIAVDTIAEFLLSHDMEVYLVVFDRSAVVLSEKLMGRIAAYIDDHCTEYPRRRNDFGARRAQAMEQAALAPCAPMPCAEAAVPKGRRSLRDLLGNLDESFSQMLLRLIDEKGMTDTEVYKRANIDRKLFSKLRKNGYNPSKQTAIALAIALRLNLDETRDLLGKAGYALSRSSKFDVIIEFFISEGSYDIYEINEALFAFDQKLLGA